MSRCAVDSRLLARELITQSYFVLAGLCQALPDHAIVGDQPHPRANRETGGQGKLKPETADFRYRPSIVRTRAKGAEAITPVFRLSLM